MESTQPYNPPTSIITRLRWSLRDAKHRFCVWWRRSCDRLKWIGHKEGNSEAYARRELELAGWFDDDSFYGDMMGHAVLRMIREFSDEGHSGMSAGIATGLFKTLADFNPLTPLTGEDDEWNEIGEGRFQNRRCSHVFKDLGPEGFTAYDSEGRIFREPDGSCFQSRDSRVTITFPYTPKREYVDVSPA